MRKKRRISFQHTGLEIATLLGRFFLDTEDLHYGYWPPDLPVQTSNLKQAQANYTGLIIKKIPSHVRTILDVGAGNGNLSKRLIEKGFQVEALTPSKYQAAGIREKLGSDFRVHVSKFEHCKTLNEYDLIIFSESFQYIPVKKALDKAVSALKDRGFLLICDFFNRDTGETSAFKGGHSWKKFTGILQDYPFTRSVDIDISNETAPNIILFANLLNEVGFPASSLFNEYLSYKYPRMMSFLRWKFRHSLTEIRNRYAPARINPEMYLRTKTYRLLVLQLP